MYVLKKEAKNLRKWLVQITKDCFAVDETPENLWRAQKKTVLTIMRKVYVLQFSGIYNSMNDEQKCKQVYMVLE